ncbi:hypothetical protein PB1_10869 [Bacillus methanolicus PB1]|uniref:Uncharacterized protein n=1 Tax=Bacillus methanolicus PB1 TaxID=997296 RepID=I3DUY7_BACMT|nr:hypothetical protein PB1_10869 [Bacillus methanolicus PB1]
MAKELELQEFLTEEEKEERKGLEYILAEMKRKR